MDKEKANAIANAWQTAWNARNLDAVLAHFGDDVVFRSPRAVALTGHGVVRGKPALAAYWRAALDSAPALHFDVVTVLVGQDTMVIVYTNHRGQTAAETLRFDAAGWVVEASACYA